MIFSLNLIIFTQVSAYIEGNDEEAKLMKRTIVRYINLSILLVLRMISLPVKRRFPTMKHLEEAGIIFGRECEVCAQSFCEFFLQILF